MNLFQSLDVAEWFFIGLIFSLGGLTAWFAMFLWARVEIHQWREKAKSWKRLYQDAEEILRARGIVK